MKKMCRLSIVLTEDHAKAVAKLERMRSWRVPYGKLWQGVGNFDVPGAVMMELSEAGYCERRKLSGSSPTEYRP